MYNGITKQLLTDAAEFAGVKQVFIVIKPYWANAEKNKRALENQNIETILINNVMIGVLRLK